jgi:Xaa-Pro aminopeptidase
VVAAGAPLVKPAFGPDEYTQRVAKTRERMAARSIDLLVVADPANINYLSGYDAWSFYTPQVIVVPPSGGLVFYTREMDRAAGLLMTDLEPDNVLGFPESYVQHTDRHPLDWIASDIARRGLGTGTVAVEMDGYYFSPRAYNALVAGLPGARFVDAEQLVNWVRAVKSPAELDLMRTAARIIERVMQVAVDAVQPGVRQCDAVAAIYDAQMRGLPDAGGEYTSFVPMIPSGPGTSTPHLTSSDRPFQLGEATILELGACYRRYHCPMARTVFLGDPPKLLVDTVKVVEEGLDAALAAVKPGATCESVEAAWRDVISREGLSKASRIGYSVGLNYPPDWGEHTMSLRPGDTSVLEPNMAFHMILGMWMDGWGFELSETFVVTDSGADCLSSFPRELAVKR